MICKDCNRRLTTYEQDSKEYVGNRHYGVIHRKCLLARKKRNGKKKS